MKATDNQPGNQVRWDEYKRLNPYRASEPALSHLDGYTAGAAAERAAIVAWLKAMGYFAAADRIAEGKHHEH